MDIKTIKLELIKIINDIEDEDLLNNIYLFVKRVTSTEKLVSPKDKELEEL